MKAMVDPKTMCFGILMKTLVDNKTMCFGILVLTFNNENIGISQIKL